jgi:uncharacterized membrane protein
MKRNAAPQSKPELSGPAAQNIEAIAALEREALHERSAFDRFSQVVTDAAGSAAFLGLHALWFSVWIVVNLTHQPAFDPFPFNFLMLIVSLEAIFLTGIVLLTQNRMTRQADKRAHLDLQVNLLAEQELTAMLQMLHALCRRSGVAIKVRDSRVEQLLNETDIHKIAVALDKELTPPKPAPQSR